MGFKEGVFAASLVTAVGTSNVNAQGTPLEDMPGFVDHTKNKQELAQNTHGQIDAVRGDVDGTFDERESLIKPTEKEKGQVIFGVSNDGSRESVNLGYINAKGNLAYSIEGDRAESDVLGDKSSKNIVQQYGAAMTASFSESELIQRSNILNGFTIQGALVISEVDRAISYEQKAMSLKALVTLKNSIVKEAYVMATRYETKVTGASAEFQNVGFEDNFTSSIDRFEGGRTETISGIRTNTLRKYEGGSTTEVAIGALLQLGDYVQVAIDYVKADKRSNLNIDGALKFSDNLALVGRTKTTNEYTGAEDQDIKELGLRGNVNLFGGTMGLEGGPRRVNGESDEYVKLTYKYPGDKTDDIISLKNFDATSGRITPAGSRISSVTKQLRPETIKAITVETQEALPDQTLTDFDSVEGLTTTPISGGVLVDYSIFDKNGVQNLEMTINGVKQDIESDGDGQLRFEGAPGNYAILYTGEVKDGITQEYKKVVLEDRFTIEAEVEDPEPTLSKISGPTSAVTEGDVVNLTWSAEIPEGFLLKCRLNGDDLTEQGLNAFSVDTTGLDNVNFEVIIVNEKTNEEVLSEDITFDVNDVAVVENPTLPGPISGDGVDSPIEEGNAGSVSITPSDADGIATVTAMLDNASIGVSENNGTYTVNYPDDLSVGTHPVKFFVTGKLVNGSADPVVEMVTADITVESAPDNELPTLNLTISSGESGETFTSTGPTTFNVGNSGSTITPVYSGTVSDNVGVDTITFSDGTVINGNGSTSVSINQSVVLGGNTGTPGFSVMDTISVRDTSGNIKEITYTYTN